MLSHPERPQGPVFSAPALALHQQLRKATGGSSLNHERLLSFQALCILIIVLRTQQRFDASLATPPQPVAVLLSLSGVTGTRTAAIAVTDRHGRYVTYPRSPTFLLSADPQPVRSPAVWSPGA
ncbi:hypothetical protein BJY01DRAFT_175054 [Aspergillus pseudoustus]|uniref:Uncharacterized protein n=1 Tax=Aspergillus pseudoustus TaxID=1810923 RepID=A0ABR4K285_9EURO